MENGFVLFKVFFGIGCGAQFFASFAEGIQPHGVLARILLLQFFTQSLRERRAFAVGGDGDLQIAALHDGAVIKVAVRNVVHGIAENAARIGCLKHSRVHGRRWKLRR